MGNMVTFAIREDSLKNFKDADFSTLSRGIHDGNHSPTLAMNHKARYAYSSNNIDGLMTSAYYHSSSTTSILFTPNILIDASFLNGLHDDHFNVVSNWKPRMAYFSANDTVSGIIGETDSYVKKNSLNTRKVSDRLAKQQGKDSGRLHIFGYLTDNTTPLEEGDTVSSILACIRSGDFKDLTNELNYICTLEANEFCVVRMHGNTFMHTIPQPAGDSLYEPVPGDDIDFNAREAVICCLAKKIVSRK